VGDSVSVTMRRIPLPTRRKHRARTSAAWDVAYEIEPSPRGTEHLRARHRDFSRPLGNTFSYSLTHRTTLTSPRPLGNGTLVPSERCGTKVPQKAHCPTFVQYMPPKAPTAPVSRGLGLRAGETSWTVSAWWKAASQERGHWLRWCPGPGQRS